MHKKCTRQLLALLLGVVLAVSMLLPVFAEASIPQPTEDYYFYDAPDVFSKKLEATILEENARLEQAYGVQLVMVAMQSLDGADIKDFTVSLMDEWQVGGEEGKGLVLVLDIDGDTYFTLAGKGLYSFLTSDVLQRLLDRNLEESFAMKNYDAGVSSFFAAVTQRIEEEFGTAEESTEPGETSEGSEETEPESETEEAAEPTEETVSETQAPVTEAPEAVTESQEAEPQASAKRSSGSGFWGVVKVIFWIALILLCLILLLFVILVIRRRRYEKQREARRRAKQRRDYDQR